MCWVSPSAFRGTSCWSGAGTRSWSYIQSPLKPWFKSLRSGKGPCCSDADGFALSDPDWESKNGHYRVRIDNEWIDVPDDAVITEPNRVGRTMVWPIKGAFGISVRCFMPGSMTLIRAPGLLHCLHLIASFVSREY